MADSTLFELCKNCENHTDQNIVLYCCQHDKLICDSCLPVSHQNCKSIIPIEKAAKGVKDGAAIFDLEGRISNLCQVTENIRSKRETTLVDLEKNRNKIKKRVSEIKQNIIAHLDRLEAEMHKDIDSKYIICTEMVSRNRNDIQSSLDSLFTWESDLKSLKQHTSEIYLFKVVKFLDAKTYQKELEIREIQTATVPILTYHPSESESNITKLIQDLGRIAIENVQIQMPLLDIDQQGQFLVRDERKLSLKHSFPSTKLRNKVRINKGCFIPGDRLLLCQDLGKQLFVCALDGSNTNIIYLDHKAQNITLNNKNHAVVSVGDAGIQIIDLTSLKPGKIIPVDGCCFGIACVKDKIWVNNRKCTLTIMDINGKILQKIKTTFDPQEICANQDGDIYCTDNNSEKLYVVTSDGIEREIYNSPELICTVGVAVDDRGDVYVAGCSSDNIHRISNDGQKHDIVLTAQDGINGPSGLSYNTDTRELLVFNDFKKSVNVFQTQ